jgi:hypothetical protein
MISVTGGEVRIGRRGDDSGEASLKLPMKPDNALPVRFEVSLDGIGRPSTERFDFLLSEAVVVSLLGCPLSEAMAPIAVWWSAN